jgi:hypothetical protein
MKRRTEKNRGLFVFSVIVSVYSVVKKKIATEGGTKKNAEEH